MINDEIQEITRRFVDALHPEKIILFGSYAKDTERDDSDYDFYIVMDDSTSKNMIEIEQDAYRSLIGMHGRKSVDVLANTTGGLARRASMPTIERDVMLEGVTLYG